MYRRHRDADSLEIGAPPLDDERFKGHPSRPGISRVKGLTAGLFSGALGAVSALISRIAFDFTLRPGLGNETNSALHWVANKGIAIAPLRLTTLPMVNEVTLTQWLSGKIAVEGILKLSESYCGAASMLFCATDHLTRIALLAVFLFLGAVQISIYLAALRLLPSAVEATAAIFASNFVLSGLIGAAVFGEWVDRSLFGVIMWIVGAMTMVVGVVVIATDREATKVKPDDAYGKQY